MSYNYRRKAGPFAITLELIGSCDKSPTYGDTDMQVVTHVVKLGSLKGGETS